MSSKEKPLYVSQTGQAVFGGPVKRNVQVEGTDPPVKPARTPDEKTEPAKDDAGAK